MDPVLASGIAVLSWLAVRRRSVLSRLLLVTTLVLLGWEPAGRSDGFGILLLVIAGGVAASLVWDGFVAAGPNESPSRRPHIRAADDTRRSPRPAGEPLTELEQADALGVLLDANIGGLQAAKHAGDVRAQAAFAGEVAELAADMQAMLRVVLGERHRLTDA